MAEIRVSKVEKNQSKIRDVPVAVTPEGFWCCPSPVVFPKSLKSQTTLIKPNSSPPPSKATTFAKKQTPHDEKRPRSFTLGSVIESNDQQNPAKDLGPDRTPRQKVETLPKKVAIRFGEARTSDAKVILVGKQGFCIKLNAHSNVLVSNSRFFAGKFAGQESGLPCMEIDDCDDIEIYVETVGLMYCKDMKQRLIKQSVPRVLRILKVAEQLGFESCIRASLDYLEAVPWVGDEEEKVVSSVTSLQDEGIAVSPILKRVISCDSVPPQDTLSQIINLVLESSEERSRHQMKITVIKLITEHNNTNSGDLCAETIHKFCESCLDNVLTCFRQTMEPESRDESETNGLAKRIALQADNLTWLLEILCVRQAADEFAILWGTQKELSLLHEKMPMASRYHISRVTARAFIGIGRGEMLPSKDTRTTLLQTWLQPLIDDYRWLRCAPPSFDTKLVEEGIGRTVLTLPLEEQRRVLVSWLRNYLKNGGDGCPNLQRAFEVWWRRAFVRSYGDLRGDDIDLNLVMSGESPVYQKCD